MYVISVFYETRVGYIVAATFGDTRVLKSTKISGSSAVSHKSGSVGQRSYRSV